MVYLYNVCAIYCLIEFPHSSMHTEVQLWLALWSFALDTWQSATEATAASDAHIYVSSVASECYRSDSLSHTHTQMQRHSRSLVMVRRSTCFLFDCVVCLLRFLAFFASHFCVLGYSEPNAHHKSLLYTYLYTYLGMYVCMCVCSIRCAGEMPFLYLSHSALPTRSLLSIVLHYLQFV